jgi:lysyl-tRNA synthetase class 2
VLNWQPTASLEALKKRANIIRAIRCFLDTRGVLEVDTPLLMPSIGTDVTLVPFQVDHHYLQTSPEFALKRLVAAGSGDVYQLGKAFRNEEKGRYHNHEFMILEWYRVGWNLTELMIEMDTLLQTVCGWPKAEIWTYQALFQQYVGFCPHTVSLAFLRDFLAPQANAATWTRDDCLQAILATFEPQLGQAQPLMLTDYPASQAALAKTKPLTPTCYVAERFEVYYKGIELANGYHELTDANEQRRRFQEDNDQRAVLGLPQLPVDEKLIQAIETGFPACSGVALGVDRLIMLALGKERLSEVQCFYEG